MCTKHRTEEGEGGTKEERNVYKTINMYFIVLWQALALVCNPCKVKERFLISQKFGILKAISLPLSPSLSLLLFRGCNGS